MRWCVIFFSALQALCSPVNAYSATEQCDPGRSGFGIMYGDNWYYTLGEGSVRQEVSANTKQYIRGGQHDNFRNRNLGTVHASAK